MKKGRKTAVRFFDAEEDAEQKAAELGTRRFVEKRLGESIRCQSYCLCCDFCGFYQRNVKAAAETQTIEKAAA
jgi:hypothetical protein